MNLKALKANGPDMSAQQQGAFYHARRRRRARENANPSEFKIKGDSLGLKVTVVLQAQ